jgi:hypothetical protein
MPLPSLPVALDYSLAAYQAERSMPRGLVQRLNAGIGGRLGRTELPQES